MQFSFSYNRYILLLHNKFRHLSGIFLKIKIFTWALFFLKYIVVLVFLIKFCKTWALSTLHTVASLCIFTVYDIQSSFQHSQLRFILLYSGSGSSYYIHVQVHLIIFTFKFILLYSGSGSSYYIQVQVHLIIFRFKFILLYSGLGSSYYIQV